MDYRDMPIEKLNSNIPQGRGMIKWAPFATMPEQFETVDRLIDDQTKITRPELSDDRLEEMDRVLTKAHADKRRIKVEYYYDGRRFHITLNIVKIDMWSLMLIGQKTKTRTDDMVFISFMDILDIAML
ncbi:YolD-like family protein [Salinicoccus halodurans]|nr:YolD-like family protein [Salinicoccus halodurans]SFK89933.1 YolD-like protein [Salinicoccus halodurans]